jgi:Secretion system C-terminal sorting domain
MKKKFIFLISAFACLMTANAQETIVEPGPVGTLNTAVDNAAAGATLVLRRGAPYLTSGVVSITKAITIKAETGTGPRPIIIFSPSSGAASIDQIFNATANFKLDGVHVTNRDQLGGITQRLIRTSADNIRITVNNCLFDDSGQTAFRTDGKNNKIYMTNTIASRLGVPSNPDNGRLIDDRGVLVDSIWIENCLIYNVTSRIIRDGGEVINYFRFVNNTVYNVGQRGFEVGRVKQFIFLNNIVGNGQFLGRRQSVLASRNEADQAVLRIDSIPNKGSGPWTIGYNNFYREPEMVAATPAKQSDGDTVVQAAYFDVDALAAIKAGNWEKTNIEEVVKFTNKPKFPVNFIEIHHTGTIANALPWDHTGIPTNTVYSALNAAVPRYSVSHDFGYPKGQTSYVAGTDGKPLGCNLFASTTSSAKDLFDENGIIFYPNPVKSSIFIQGLEQIVQIQLFDIKGALVQSVMPGNAYTELSVGQLPPGAYILSVIDAKGNISGRKIMKD